MSSGPSEPNLALKLAGRWYGLGADNESRAAKPQPLQNGRRGLGTEGEEEEEEKEEKWGKGERDRTDAKPLARRGRWRRKEKGSVRMQAAVAAAKGAARADARMLPQAALLDRDKARGVIERQTSQAKQGKARKPDNYNVRVALIGPAMPPNREICKSEEKFHYFYYSSPRFRIYMYRVDMRYR